MAVLSLAQQPESTQPALPAHETCGRLERARIHIDEQSSLTVDWPLRHDRFVIEEPHYINFYFTASEKEVLVEPRVRTGEIFPLTLFALSSIFTAVFLCFFLIGIPWSLVRAEWIGAAVSTAFAILSGWLLRISLTTLQQAGPRHLRYTMDKECFELTRWGWKTCVPRSLVKSIWLRVDVCHGGLKRAPGIWLYLIVEKLSGKTHDFHLTRLPSTKHLKEAKIQDVLHKMTSLAGVPAGRIKTRNI